MLSTLLIFALVSVLSFTADAQHAIRTPIAQTMRGSSVIRNYVPNGDRRRYCRFENRLYAHNAVFSRLGSSRCIRYRCWYGTVRLQEEGCDVGGCRRVGSVFDFNCNRYSCEKSVQGGYYLYQTHLLSTRCRGDDGYCHTPGTYFPYTIRGRSSNHCTCSVNNRHIRYTCQFRH